MVAHLVRLKFRLLAGSLRGSVGRIIGVVLAAAYGLMMTAIGVFGLFTLRVVGDAELSRIVFVCGGSLAVLGWVVLPLFAFGVDETLDPLRFQTFAVPMRTLVTGLFAASFVSVPAIVTSILLLAAVVTWSYSVLAIIAALLAAVLGAATCVAASRAATSAAASALSGRRSRDVLSIIALLALVAFGPAINYIAGSHSDVGSGTFASLADVLGWTPFGFAFAAPADVASGHVATALIRLVLAAVTLAVLLAAWAYSLARTLERGPTHRQQTGRVSGGLGWFSRLPGSPAGAIAARTLTYWRRDPRYFGSIALIVLLPLLIIGYSFVTSDAGRVADGAYLAVAPIVAYLIGWSVHADVSTDNTAFALHVAAGVSGRADRIGRLAPWASVGVPIVLLYACAASWMTGRWDLLPTMVGLSLCLILTGLGLSSVTSVAYVYPTAAPGDSPFRSPPGSTGMTMLVQFVTMAVIVVLALPVLIPALIAMVFAPAVGWIVLPAGIVLGSVYLVVGVRRGSMIFDRRAPGVLASIHSFASR